MDKFTEKQEENIRKAAQILSEREVKSLQLYRFGIYYQYELAGEKVRRDYLEEYNESKLSDEDYNQITELLSFTDTKSFTDDLGFPDEGQNVLILTNEGKFNYKNFYI